MKSESIKAEIKKTKWYHSIQLCEVHCIKTMSLIFSTSLLTVYTDSLIQVWLAVKVTYRVRLVVPLLLIYPP